jgi:hypothetical protein
MSQVVREMAWHRGNRKEHTHQLSKLFDGNFRTSDIQRKGIVVVVKRPHEDSAKQSNKLTQHTGGLSKKRTLQSPQRTIAGESKLQIRKC